MPTPTATCTGSVSSDITNPLNWVIDATGLPPANMAVLDTYILNLPGQLNVPIAGISGAMDNQITCVSLDCSQLSIDGSFTFNCDLINVEGIGFSNSTPLGTYYVNGNMFGKAFLYQNLQGNAIGFGFATTWTVQGNVSLNDLGNDINGNGYGCLAIACDLVQDAIAFNVTGNLNVLSTNTSSGIGISNGNNDNAAGTLSVGGYINSVAYGSGVSFNDYYALDNGYISASDIYGEATGTNGVGVNINGSSDTPIQGNLDTITANSITGKCLAQNGQGIYFTSNFTINCPLVIGYANGNNPSSAGIYINGNFWSPSTVTNYNGYNPQGNGIFINGSYLENCSFTDSEIIYIQGDILTNGYGQVVFGANQWITTPAGSSAWVGSFINYGTFDNHYGYYTFSGGTRTNYGQYSGKLDFSNLSNVFSIGAWKKNLQSIGPYKVTTNNLGPYPIRTNAGIVQNIGPYVLSSDGTSLGPNELIFALP